MTWWQAIFKPISDMVTAGTKRKQAKETGLQKIQQAQVDGKNDLDMTDAEWEAVNAGKADSSYKDEFVTVTVLLWMWVGMYGAIWDRNVLDSVKVFLDFCTTNDVDMGNLSTVVIMAAVGLKVWRGR